MKKNKMLALFLGSVMVLSLGACGTAPEKKNSEPSSAASVQMANPYVEYSSLEEAEKAAGFELVIPKTFEEQAELKIGVIDSRLLEVEVSEKGNTITLRKAEAVEDSEELSGDYNTYEFEKSCTIGDYTVDVKGNGEKIQNAFWTKDGYSYSIGLENGISEADLEELILQMK